MYRDSLCASSSVRLAILSVFGLLLGRYLNKNETKVGITMFFRQTARDCNSACGWFILIHGQYAAMFRYFAENTTIIYQKRAN